MSSLHLGARLASRFARPAALAAAVALGGCAHVAPDPVIPESDVTPSAAPRLRVQIGEATWYGGRLAGRRTANGERFDPRAMTAAHRTLPFGTWVEVTRLDTGRRVRVRVTDRGPFGHAERIIDLSEHAAHELDMLRAGVARVEVRVVDGP